MLHDVLDESVLLPRLEAETPAEVIDRLLDRVCSTGKVRDREKALRDIMDNERRMSTGMQHGIAIPHAKSETVDDVVAAVAVTTHPVRLPDETDARIIILLLSPIEGTGPHIRFLAEIGRLLRQGSLRQRLLAAETASEMRTVLAP